MKNTILSIAALTCISLFSCKKDDNDPEHFFKGADVAVGSGGSVRTYFETDEASHIKTVSISFDKGVFDAMPQGDGHAGHEHPYSYKLTLPAGVQALTPFDHIELGWNPHGHPPEHVYDKPHFDFHFYTITEAEQAAIPEYGADSAGFLAYPAAAYLPPMYIPIPGGEAMMGTHWLDVTSPELSRTAPQPFTQTMIYGSYGGKVAFLEPMITLDFLKTGTGFTRAIPQPEKFSKEGYYPTQMSVIDKGATLEVSLHGFVLRTKS